MKKKMAAGLGIFTVGAIALASSLTVAQQNEYQLVRQFGKVKRIIEEPGIYFKVPFVESVSTLPKETLIYDLTPSDVITKDKKTMICDSYVLWRIEDPLKFAQTLNSSLSNAESRLNTSVYNATKNVISSMDQDQVISGRTGSLSEKVMENIGTNMEQYGIELLSFETKQLDLPNDNKEAVYERMISERENIAALFSPHSHIRAVQTHRHRYPAPHPQNTHSVLGQITDGTRPLRRRQTPRVRSADTVSGSSPSRVSTHRTAALPYMHTRRNEPVYGLDVQNKLTYCRSHSVSSVSRK